MSEKGGPQPQNLIEILEHLEHDGASSAEKAAAMERFIELKARSKGIPLRGTLELTPLCNLDCKMCYVHLSNQQLSKEASELLSGKQWISIIRQAIDLGLMEVTLTGGEALLHPDFDEIFTYLTKNNINVNLKTNGLLLTNQRVSFLSKHNISSIQISVYGHDEDSYHRVTGHRVFAKISTAIREVYEAGIPCEIVITPSQYMWSSIKELLQWVQALGIRYKVNPGLVIPLEETGRSTGNHDLTLDQYVELNKFMFEQKGGLLSPTCIDNLPQPGSTSNVLLRGIRCAAGRSTFAVTWRGMVHPCRMFEKIGFDATKTNFDSGWLMLNAQSKAYPVPHECIGCKYDSICPVCIVQHEYGTEPGHANPNICKRTLRMFQEGLYITESLGGIKHEKKISNT